MAKLARLKRYEAPEGEWTTLESEGESFDIRIRPLNPEYHDREHDLRRAEARRLTRQKSGGQIVTSDDLPPSAINRAMAEAVIDTILVDVVGLEHEDGTAMSLSEFKDLLRDDAYNHVVGVIWTAAGKLAAKNRDAVKAAEGN